LGHNLADTLLEVKTAFYTLKQGKNMSLHQHHELFLRQIDVLKDVGVTIADYSLIEEGARINIFPGITTNEDKDPCC
jgi:hypothetical protein